MTVRERLAALWQRFANALQPRIARSLQDERPEMHEARRRLHFLVITAELERLRNQREQEQ